jgi:hypothetical protein
MTDNHEDMLKSMNATTILIAVLNQIGSISITTKDFLEVNSEDRQLSVEYDSDSMSFTFKMQEEVSSEEDLNNAPKEYKLTGRIY